MIQVVPIVAPRVDWNILLVLAGKGLGRSLTKSIDAHRWQLTEQRAAIAAFAEFQESDSNAIAVLRDPGSVLRHFMFSFAVLANRDTLYEIAIDGNVDILDCERDDFAIVSANLEDWRTTIIKFCSSRATGNQREFYYRVLEQFDNIGLSVLFDNYSRKAETMMLVHK
jgi:hypothetical protein